MLEQLGYSVRKVSSPDTALEAVGIESFDLIISDIVMPGETDGVALARLIRERHPGVPILLVTGYNPAAEASAEFVVLRKPLELGQLSRIAARMIAESKQPPTTNIVRLRGSRSGSASEQK
jgi:DNA-binding NtrC family response regulator